MTDLSEPSDNAGTTYQPDVTIPFAEGVKVWLRVAALSFGGPAGQIAVMHRILVEEKRWVGENRFLHALSYCMLLPGPEAQQLAVYLGWLLHKTKGGIVAGALFVLPGFVSILALSYIYVIFAEARLVEGLFFGLKAAVLALVANALVRIGTRALRNPAMVAIAAAAFLAIFVFDVPFPAIILVAALVGFLGERTAPSLFGPATGHAAGKGFFLADADSVLGQETPAHARPNLGWSLMVSVVFLVLWLAPVLALLAMLGLDNVFSQIALFFSQMAVVTFGGAYAVLAYVAQEAVGHYGWLQPGEMLDGLGMAETTPGPLIQVVQFVGFLGAYRDPGTLPPLVAASLAAVLTTWVTFVPCFLWIFLGAPFIEKLRENRALGAAMSAVTAAVVGVICNLTVWFALHTLFADLSQWRGFGASLEIPAWASLDPVALALTAAALAAIFALKAGPMLVLVAAALVGAAWSMLT
ncbi:chromate efflux transporter [Devosia nitrariae]|uniref:Chromate transporter n=1 Tax=Devosia nitrariae TaxID=2071872 RepID=A0ABQ5W1W6_9HYPH|nr:chromate efflux transporter [Devosia nitrariae]GLQ54062.1 chromate transporter [Devosia nitrariae]